jgi:hypothetical protein
MQHYYFYIRGISVAQTLTDATPQIIERRKTDASKTVDFIRYRF